MDQLLHCIWFGTGDITFYVRYTQFNYSYFSCSTQGHFLSHVHHHVHIALTVDFKKIYILSYHKEHRLAITVVKDSISKMNL